MVRSRIALAAASAIAVAAPAWGQEVKKVEQVVVTASPLGRAESELAQPATVLSEEDLRRRRAASIGDTLSQEAGVHSSAFGPAAGRPIIRGLDGPRIRVLENGIGTMDASAVSPDHAVATESLNAEQVEILRGPASLLYGSGAIGGVVNVVSGVVPRGTRAPGASLEARAGSANRERTAATSLDGRAGAGAFRLDASARRTRDYETPLGRLAGSDVDARGGGAGASWVGERGYLGAGIQARRSNYGIPSGEGTRIDLAQDRVEAAGELAIASGGLTRARFRIGRGDYRHDEIEPGGKAGTRFENDAVEGRLEVRHAALAGWKGTLGAQLQDREQSAIGEEAILPRTRARERAFFVVEEIELGAFTVDLGVRSERETRRPEGGLPARDFSLVTPAVGVVWRVGAGHRVGFAATQAQRAPSIEELYSRGAHRATATFDVGDAALRKEVSRNLDVTLRRTAGAVRWRVNLFANRVRDYVYAAAGDTDGDGLADRVDAAGSPEPGGEFLVQRFTQGAARFRGAEAEISWRPAPGTWAVRLFADTVRGRLAAGANLPRISPSRLGASAEGTWGRLTAQATAVRVLEQRRVAPLESPTPGYARIDADAAWKVAPGARGNLTFFVQATNLGDKVIRVHTSYLKDAAPLMGRSVVAGLRGEF